MKRKQLNLNFEFENRKHNRRPLTSIGWLGCGCRLKMSSPSSSVSGGGGRGGGPAAGGGGRGGAAAGATCSAARAAGRGGGGGGKCRDSADSTADAALIIWN